MADLLNDLPIAAEFSPNFLEKSYTLYATEILTSLSSIVARAANDAHEFDEILSKYMRGFGEWLINVGPDDPHDVDKHNKLFSLLAIRLNSDDIASSE